MPPSREPRIVLKRCDARIQTASGQGQVTNRNYTDFTAPTMKTENELASMGICSDETRSDYLLQTLLTNGRGTAADKVNGSEQFFIPPTGAIVKIESNDKDESIVTGVLVSPLCRDFGKTSCANAEGLFATSSTSNKETASKKTRHNNGIHILQSDTHVEVEDQEGGEGHVTKELVGLFSCSSNDRKIHRIDADDQFKDLSTTNEETEEEKVTDCNRLNIPQASVNELEEGQNCLTRELVASVSCDFEGSRTHLVDGDHSSEDLFAGNKLSQPEEIRDGNQAHILQINLQVKIEDQEEMILSPDSDDSKPPWTNGADLSKDSSAVEEEVTLKNVKYSDQRNMLQIDLHVNVEEQSGEKSSVTNLINFVSLNTDDSLTHQTSEAGPFKDTSVNDSEIRAEHARDRNQLNFLQTNLQDKIEEHKEQKCQVTRELIVRLSHDLDNSKAQLLNPAEPSKDSFVNKGIRAEGVRERSQRNTSQINTGVIIEEQVEEKGQIARESVIGLSRDMDDWETYLTDEQDPSKDLSPNNKDSKVEELRDRSPLNVQESNSPIKIERSEEEKVPITQRLVAPSSCCTDNSKCDSKALLRTVKCEESETRIEGEQLSNLNQFSFLGRDNVCIEETGEESFDLTKIERNILPNLSRMRFVFPLVMVNDLFPKNFVAGSKEVLLSTDESYPCVYSEGNFKLLTKGPANTVLNNSLSSGRSSCSRKKKRIKNPKKRMFMCMFCSVKFKFASSLKRHATVAHGHGKLNSCQHCTETFTLKRLLLQHYSETHPGEKVFKQKKKYSSKTYRNSREKLYCCSECPYRCHSKFVLKAHSRIHSGDKPFDCKKCLKKFRTRSQLNCHMLTHTNRRPLKCADCAARFKSKNHLINHVSIHTNERPYSCTECSAKFRTRWILSAHLVTHSFERRYSCTECSAKFKTNSSLTSHLVTHSSERRFECAHCSHRCKSKIAIRSHVRSHFDERPYSCPLCWAKFKNGRALKSHHRMKHSSERPFECSQCGARFKDKPTLKGHLITHSDERPFQCPHCMSTFRLHTHLKTHLVVKHTGERLYTCEHCSAKFKQKTLLARHLMTHSDAKPHQCPQCPMTFTRKDTLKEHFRCHTGEKPYSCPQCRTNFREGSQLKRHLASHSEERPFSCNQCPARFKRSDTLKEHIQHIHMDIEKRQACSQCPFRTRRVHHLKEHLKKHSDEKPFSCDQCHVKFKTLRSLKRHAKKVHTNKTVSSCDKCSMTFRYEKTFQAHCARGCVKNRYACSQCPYKFPSLLSLRTHSDVHTNRNERKYSCEHCLAKFTQKVSVKTHILTVHMGEKHVCLYCPSSFTSKQNLLNHLKRHPSEKSDE